MWAFGNIGQRTRTIVRLSSENTKQNSQSQNHLCFVSTRSFWMVEAGSRVKLSIGVFVCGCRYI